MSTPEERIAAGQELRKRGKLSSQQDAALKELERRYGLSAAPAVGKRGSMVKEETISREEYMAQRGGAGFGGRPVPKEVGTYAGGPMATYADEGLLGKKPVASKAMIRDVGATKLALETPQDMNVNKMSRAQSVALGVNDLNPVRLATGDRGYKAAMTESLRDNPVSTRLGQAAAFTSGGGAQLGVKALTVAPKLVAPAVAARFAGQSIGAQTARYTGRGALLAGTGAADYYAYNAFAEAPNQFREQGLGTPTVGDRIDYASSQVFTPGGAIAAGLGPLASMVYRPVRAAVAGTKNLVTTGTARPAVTAGRPTLPAAAGQSAKAPLTNLFTPSDVQKRVGAISATTKTRTGRTAREEAIDLVLAKGFQPDEAEKLVKLISYDNYASVDEMLFELANADVDQLTVAMGRIGGDAKKTLREAFKARNANMPDQIRVALRDAMGLSGDDLEDFAKQMATRADEATSEGYAAAYATQVSDDTWAKIWDRFRASPDAAAALAAASRLARNSYRGNPAQLEVARQLDELAGALRSPDVTPPKLSTHALDYLDRGFGSLIAGEKKNNKAFAASLIEIQKAIRNAGLDADTGLNGPREVYSQFMAASRALDYGAKAFGRGTPLRDIKKQFAASLKDADEVFEDIAGEGQSIIDQALIMGWLRGAEDAVETATNPGALIRQIYGSERQRAKLLEMMPKLSDKAAAGVKGDQTKRIRALVGGKRSDGKGSVESIFERQRRMLESQGRVSGNSQTADAQEAIFAQGGRQRFVNTLVGALMNPQEAAKNAALWAVERVTTPAIFKPEVNRELGNILSTRGRDELLAVIAEIRARQLATGKGPKPPATPPAGGATPPSAPTPPPTGGTPAANALAPKPGKLGTRTADAAAIATLGLQGGTAEADTGGVSAELKTANERVNTATKRIETADSELARLREEVLLLERVAAEEPPVPLVPTAEGKRVQRILAARNFDLGPNGVDGRVGNDTRKALAGNIAAIKSDIAKTEAERESALKEAVDARNAEKQAQYLQMQRDAEPSSSQGLLVGGAALGAAIAGAMLAKGGRFRNVNFGRYGSQIKSAAKAAATTRKVNKLINTGKITSAQSGANSINQRAANVNTIAQIGGAGRRVPFEETATGVLQERSRKNIFGSTIRPMETSELFKPQRFNANDAYAFGVAGLDVAITEGGIRHLKSEIKAAEAEMERAKNADDRQAFYAALKEKQSNEGLLVFAQIAQKVGMGYIGGRAISGIKPYSAPTPDLAGIRAERTLILQAINKPPPKPRKPAGTKPNP